MSLSTSGSSSRGGSSRSDVAGINSVVDAGAMTIATKQGVFAEGDEIIPGAPGQPTRFRRRVVRQQELPYMRKVKVPVFTKKVVPTTFKKRIKTKKLIEVPYVKDVEEKYTVLVEEQKTRMKKVWVQETQQETYMKKVPVIKRRMVKKPVMKIVEQDDFQLVTIPGTKMIDVHGWRIDEIEEKKVIEIEEFEVYELLPHNTGKLVQGASRDLGRIDGPGHRKIGQVIYSQGDLNNCGINWAGIEVDDNTATEQVSRTPLWANAHGHTSFDMSSRGYTNLYEWNSHFGSTEVKTVVREKFDLEKCLLFTNRYLKQTQSSHGIKDIDALVEEIAGRWRLVDDDESGLLTYDELRTAVWRREPDNAGKAVPAGKFQPALQDVVDQIYHGCGSKSEFTYWDFAHYVIAEEHPVTPVNMPTPPDGWADAYNQ